MIKRTNALLIVLLVFCLWPSFYNAQIYYSKSTGNLNVPATWNTLQNGLGTDATTFAGSNTWVICNRTTALIEAGNPGSGFWSLVATATVIVGDGSNPTTLELYSGDEIKNAKIGVNNLGNLLFYDADPLANTINSGLVNDNTSIAPNSTIQYNSNGSIIIPNYYGNLIINDDAALTGTANVTGLLTIANGKVFNISNSRLNLFAKIAGAGALSAAGGTISIDAVVSSGNNGTFNFTGAIPPTINQFEASLNTGTSIKLGTDLRVTGTGGVFRTSGPGLVDISSVTLDLNNNIDHSSSGASGFITDLNTHLMITGSTSFTIANRGFRFNSSNNTLSSILVSRSGRTVFLGNAVNVLDSIAVHAGTFNSAGFLKLKSSSTKTARIGLVAGALSGNIIKETMIPGTSAGWANLGSPGISGQSISTWDTWVSSGQTKGLPMTCQGCIYGVTGTGSYFESIQGWIESSQTYDSTLTNVSNLTPGKGFWVYVGSGLNSTTDLLLENTGPAVTGATTIPITKASANGYNLIANPYPSPISWTQVMAISGNSSIVQNAVYIWNADLASGAGATTSFVGGTASPGGITSANDVIPAGQGFYVQAIAAGNLAFNEGVKVASNTSANPLLRPAKENVGQIFRVKVEGQNNDWDASVFRIHPMATPGFDGAWDAHKLFTSPGYAGYPGVYSKYTTISSKDAEGEDYSIHSFPEPSTDLTIPLLVRVKESGTYTISGLELENIPSCLILKDKLLNKTQDLQMGDYVFTINDTTSTPRFELLLCRGASAPTAIKPTRIDAHSVQILKVDNGVLVNTSFAQNTEAKIEVFNLLGQSLCNKVEISGLSNSTVLPVDLDNNIVLVKITTATDSYSKKVLLR